MNYYNLFKYLDTNMLRIDLIIIKSILSIKFIKTSLRNLVY